MVLKYPALLEGGVETWFSQPQGHRLLYFELRCAAGPEHVHHDYAHKYDVIFDFGDWLGSSA